MTRPFSRRDGVVLGLAVSVFGAAFGVLAVTSGLSVLQACAMSFLVFTGASQFAAVSVIGSGGEPATALGSALLLAARNAAYALSIGHLLPRRLVARALAAHVVVDETTGMALAQPDEAAGREAFLVTGVSLFVFWNIGTLVGAVSGSAIGDPADLGLDAAFPAGFIAFVVPHVATRPGLVAALVGAAAAVVAIPLTPAGLPVLLGAVGVVAGLAVRGRDGTGQGDL